MEHYPGTTYQILGEYEEIRKGLRNDYKYEDFDKDAIKAPDIDLQWVMGCLEPESPTYGVALGLFVYKQDGRVYLFHYNIHRPESKGPLRSNQMTTIEEVIWKDWKEFSGVNTKDTDFGMKAFWAYTPMDCLGSEAKSLRQLMISLQAYCRQMDYCTKLRRLDKKHLVWEAKRLEQQEQKMAPNSGTGGSDGLKGGKE